MEILLIEMMILFLFYDHLVLHSIFFAHLKCFLLIVDTIKSMGIYKKQIEQKSFVNSNSKKSSNVRNLNKLEDSNK